MPLFCLHAHDKKDGGAAIRAANRPAHLEWASAFADKICMAGPLLSDDGENMVGSVFIINMESLDAVKTLMADDPYNKADLFERVDIRPTKWLIGNGKPE